MQVISHAPPLIWRRTLEQGVARHVFKMVKGAQKNCRRLDGHALLSKLILSVKFTTRLEVIVKGEPPSERNHRRQKRSGRHRLVGDSSPAHPDRSTQACISRSTIH